ncbi:TRADD-N-associated membrane domain-containing protein [Actinomadura nitritigenes]|uniref:TRADD-N-associated membrane domain-containing protein n=1 Tax=Actinomadura nitritigenes TaxID=134602 RepID=UPI003D8A6DE4
MKLPRVIVASVFLVIGGLIAVPALMDTSEQSGGNGTSGNIWLLVLSAIAVLAFVVIGYIDYRITRQREARRNSEADRIRRAAGVPAAPPAEVAGAEDELEKALVKRMAKLERTLEKLRLADSRDHKIIELKEELSKLQEQLSKNGHTVAQYDPRAIRVEIYLQAREHLTSSYRIGQAISTAGALLFLFGISLAFFRPHGSQTAAILSAVGGSITNLTTGVFFAQTNRAREHLERQAESLREDALIREFIYQSQQVIETVTDESMRDELRVQVVRRILGGSEAAIAEVQDEAVQDPWYRRIRTSLSRRML